ncbi:MAG: nitroreductase [SAR324 cluster bacterium]|nr:nitroreductase [SAR324 cluster bacterium]
MINPTLKLLLNRRSAVAANMSEPGPTSEELQLILKAGIRVPDHGKLAPWRIKVLHKSGQQKLGKLFVEIHQKNNPDTNPTELEKEQIRPQRAPVLLVVASFLQTECKIPLSEQRLSGGAVCQNILTAAHSLGYVGQWLTEWPAYDPDVKQALGFGDQEEIIGFLYLGTAKEPPKPRKRANLEDVMELWE